MIDQQAVTKLGAGCGVVNSVPQFSRGRRGVLQRRVGCPQLLHGRPTALTLSRTELDRQFGRLG